MPVYTPTGRDCTSGPQPGTVALRDALLAGYRVTEFGDPDRADHPADVTPTDYGIFNCRPPRGLSTGLSEHGEGRAVDIGLNANDPEDRAVGDRMAADVVRHADELGVQSVIWNRRVWGYGRWFWRSYTGVNPHTDHLHIGQNWVGARDLTTERALSILQGDDMTPEQAASLKRIEQAIVKLQDNGEVHRLADPVLATNAQLQSRERWDVGGAVFATYQATVEERAELITEIAAAVATAIGDQPARTVGKLDIDALAERVVDALSARTAPTG